MVSNAYFLAKFRFDTAENEPAKICKILPILLTRPAAEDGKRDRQVIRRHVVDDEVELGPRLRLQPAGHRGFDAVRVLLRVLADEEELEPGRVLLRPVPEAHAEDLCWV